MIINIRAVSHNMASEYKWKLGEFNFTLNIYQKSQQTRKEKNGGKWSLAGVLWGGSMDLKF